MIELINVSKSYNDGKVKAVDNINLLVNPGEIFGFLGPNGAGKSTTIKMIVGILKPDTGKILVDGIDIQKEPVKAKRQIGYVPDEPNVYEKLTGLEYLNFIADVYGIGENERRERIGYFLEIFDLKNAIGDLIQSYSHGMRQKLLITAALLHNPSVWILDEPITGLDPKSSFLLKELMADHAKKGFTVFFSTHILEVAEKLCDRIAIINKGKIIASGTMEEIKKQHEWESLEKIFLELTEK
ncbi:ABC transporter ATP-binding protein [Caldanaerobacter sp.]|uniref:ABC transporter ATP-binding protein n=1 Tax=Caldanaerobacter sp. TaxID=2930036 RepID=UPI003C744AC7